MKDYFRNALAVISRSIESLDEKQLDLLLEDCKRCVQSGGKIIASGLGKNVPICEKFVGTLHSLGIPSAFLHANSAMHGDLGMVQKGDLLILLSKSGNTAESVELAVHLLNRSINVWLISFEEHTCLSDLIPSKIILLLENEGDKWNILPNNSTSVYLILLQGLAVNLAESLNVSLNTFRINHPGGDIGGRLNGELNGG